MASIDMGETMVSDGRKKKDRDAPDVLETSSMTASFRVVSDGVTVDDCVTVIDFMPVDMTMVSAPLAIPAELMHADDRLHMCVSNHVRLEVPPLMSRLTVHVPAAHCRNSPPGTNSNMTGTESPTAHVAKLLPLPAVPPIIALRPNDVVAGPAGAQYVSTEHVAAVSVCTNVVAMR